MASPVGGWLMVRAHSFSPTTECRLATLTVVVAPIFFSGLAFPPLFRSGRDLSDAMAANVPGGLCDGLLEVLRISGVPYAGHGPTFFCFRLPGRFSHPSPAAGVTGADLETTTNGS